MQICLPPVLPLGISGYACMGVFKSQVGHHKPRGVWKHERPLRHQLCFRMWDSLSMSLAGELGTARGAPRQGLGKFAALGHLGSSNYQHCKLSAAPPCPTPLGVSFPALALGSCCRSSFPNPFWFESFLKGREGSP